MRDAFDTLVQTVVHDIAGRPLDGALQDWLNAHYSPQGSWFQEMASACKEGIQAGWMCKHEADGVKYGRVTKPSPETGGFSVDVVSMADLRGPHHRHPNGEIDLIMPLTPDALFDDCAAGWKVYGPDSAHYPTVSNGAACILYLLPDGKIEFTRNQ